MVSRWAYAAATLGCLALVKWRGCLPSMASTATESDDGPRQLAQDSRFPLKQGAVSVSNGHLQMAGKDIGHLPGKVIGVGGFLHAELARDLGFEAFRTWGSGSLVWALKAAEVADTMVVAGLDMTRDPRYYQGVENCHDMETSKWWANHAESILATVRKNKDESRILWWIVGNELETPVPKKACVFRRVNWMVRKLKAVDPAHPVGLAIAGSDRQKLHQIASTCPDLDILGMNLYGNDHFGISDTLRRAGWHKPWALTECGTAAPWQVPKTSWGGMMEPLTSTSKGQFIYNGLHRCKMDEKCVGFFAFLWGWKWEKTGTWFGLLDTWKAAGGIDTGYLNDVSQPILDEISPESAWPLQLRIHLEDVIIHGPKQNASATLGFNAQRGAKVPVDLRIVATPDEQPGNIWMDWYVTKETTVGAMSDGNIPEKELAMIPGAVYFCKNGYRSLVLTDKLDPGSYRLYAFARRTRYMDRTVREAAASIPFHVGNQSCEDVKEGTCFNKVRQAMTSAKRMGVASWPAAGLLPSSSFQEFQAAFFAKHQGCTAPCSMDLPADFKGTCEGASWNVHYVSNSQEASDLLFAKPPKKEDTKCQDTKWGEKCFWAVRWLMKHPQAFPELLHPTAAEAQLALWKRDQHGCHYPCETNLKVKVK